jgi:major type 1 subunit fimbrin (pilin)
MMKGNIKYSAVFSVLILLAVGFFSPAKAATCEWIGVVKGPINTVIPLLVGNLNVGQDAPIGTIIYQQYFYPVPALSAQCGGSASSYQTTFIYRYTSTPKPLVVGYTGQFAGYVYETDIPGVGFAAVNGKLPFPASPASYTGNPSDSFPVVTDFYIYLIKTGPIASGTIIGSNLPSVATGFTAGENVLTAVTASFSGAINIVSSTCTTPDLTVQMGTYEISQNFKAAGSFSDWRDASVTLTNCPVFNGTLNDGGRTIYYNDGTSRIGNFTANYLTLSLTPNTPVIDSANGIIGISGGANAASGVGIQLAYGTTNTPQLVNFSTQKNYPQPVKYAGNVTIPLVARYIQTGSPVLPGQANATVTYTIYYY